MSWYLVYPWGYVENYFLGINNKLHKSAKGEPSFEDMLWIWWKCVELFEDPLGKNGATVGRIYMEAYWCHGVQKNRHILTAPEHLLTAPEDLKLFRKIYNCYGRLITAPEHLPTAPEHLQTAPEHFRNCSGALS